MTKQKKKLTKIQILKARITELEYKLNDAIKDGTYWETKYDEVKNNLNKKEDSYKTFLNTIEGTERPVIAENQWLRDTLRLVITPKGREEELAKLINIEQEKRYR